MIPLKNNSRLFDQSTTIALHPSQTIFDVVPAIAFRAPRISKVFNSAVDLGRKLPEPCTR